MNDAIKLAIEKGGYLKGPYWWPAQKPNGIELRGDDQDKEFRTSEQIVLDPLFWQALGKALGWPMYGCESCFTMFDLKKLGSVICSNCGHHGAVRSSTYQACRYIRRTFIGGDTEKFWTHLLKPLAK